MALLFHLGVNIHQFLRIILDTIMCVSYLLFYYIDTICLLNGAFTEIECHHADYAICLHCFALTNGLWVSEDVNQSICESSSLSTPVLKFYMDLYFIAVVYMYFWLSMFVKNLSCTCQSLCSGRFV